MASVTTAEPFPRRLCVLSLALFDISTRFLMSIVGLRCDAAPVEPTQAPGSTLPVSGSRWFAFKRAEQGLSPPSCLLAFH